MALTNLALTNFKKLVSVKQNVMHIATNAGHTAQNDGHTTLNVCQGPKGGLEEPPSAPGDSPTWILEKTLVL